MPLRGEPIESSRATAPPAAAGKDKFCRTCGRGAENWLRWTDVEKARLPESRRRCRNGSAQSWDRQTSQGCRCGGAGFNVLGRVCQGSPSPGAEVGISEPISGTDVAGVSPVPAQMWA